MYCNGVQIQPHFRHNKVLYCYFVYSLCHFTYSYNVFNKGRPDTGIFAPCSMYVYVKAGTNKLVIGMPRLSNWVAVGEMKDERKKMILFEADKFIKKNTI